MVLRVRVDGKGRIVLPVEVRRRLGIHEGDELVLRVEGNRIVIEKPMDPFKRLAELLGDLTFTRELRRLAEKQALKEILRGG